MNLDEVVIFHFSTELKPSSYLCRKGFEREGFDNFLDSFFKRFKCAGSSAEAADVRDLHVREKIAAAFRTWHEYAQEMFVDLMKSIAERDSAVTGARCPLCKAELERVQKLQYIYRYVKIRVTKWRCGSRGPLPAEATRA